MPNPVRRNIAIAAAGVVVASLIGVGVAAVAVDDTVTASCTEAPKVTTNSAGDQELTVTCTIPKPRATEPAPTTPAPTTPAPSQEPSTQPDPVETSANQVTIGGATRSIDGFNKYRDTNQLILYTAGTTTGANRYGVEAAVQGGKVTEVRDRLHTDPGATPIPAGGYVLSGHGTAGDWVRTHARVGTTPTLGKGTPQPSTPAPTNPEPTNNPDPGNEGTTAAAPMPYPVKAQALYHMMWSNSGSPQLRNTPPEVNVINLAFLQGNPPKTVGWGSQTEASFVADAKALRARGVRIVASIGGAGGAVNVSARQAFVDGIMAYNAKVPLDGLDWDLEGQTMGQTDVVWISKELKRLRGNDFAITMAPNGSNINAYQQIANQLHREGALDFIGQQFYDAVVSYDAALGRVKQLVDGGLPQDKIGIGMMVGTADTYWTVDECVAAVKHIKARYPNLRGGYLWEAGRAGTTDWATRLAPHLKG